MASNETDNTTASDKSTDLELSGSDNSDDMEPQIGNSAGAFFASPAALERYLAHMKRGAGIAGKQRAALGSSSSSSSSAPNATSAAADQNATSTSSSPSSIVFESLKVETEIRYDSGARSGGLDPYVEVLGGAVQVDSIKTRVESVPGFST
jgi:hypothetical protein